VALLGGKVVGLTVAYADSFALPDRSVECVFGRRVCIEESLQRSGLGASLLIRVADKAIVSAYGPDYPIVWVTSQANPKSTRFYAKAGFVPAGVRTNPDGHTDNIYLATALELKEKFEKILRPDRP